MTLASMTALFGAMAVLAAIPSVSVLAVVTRSASSGFRHGAATAAGIVLGDLLFILLAVLGLMLLVEALGEWSVLIRYAAAAYLLWLGLRLWRSRSRDPRRREGAGHASLKSSFMAGLLLTLADQKAVLFYLAFFPAFVDLTALGWGEIGLVAATAVVAVGGVKLGYAYLADRAGTFLGPRIPDAMNAAAAAVLVAAGLFVLAGA